MNRIYEVLELKYSSQGTVLCKFGEMGQTFFVILNGEVGIMVPTPFEEQFDTYLDLLNVLLLDYSLIREMKDSISRELLRFIEVIGVEKLKSIKFKNSDHFSLFVGDVARQDPPTMEDFEIEITAQLAESRQRFEKLAHYIKQQARQRTNALITGDKNKHAINVSGKIFKEVSFNGTFFGERSLQSDKPIAATVFVKSQQAAFITLSKRDYKRQLGADLKAKDELEIGKIRQFEVFRQLSRIKMDSLKYYFIEKQFKRGQYLFRQGDLIDGVFCILDGGANLIKEMWTMAKQDEDDAIVDVWTQRPRKNVETQLQA